MGRESGGRGAQCWRLMKTPRGFGSCFTLIRFDLLRFAFFSLAASFGRRVDGRPSTAAEKVRKSADRIEKSLRGGNKCPGNLRSLSVQHEHDSIPRSVMLPTYTTSSVMTTSPSLVITNRARHPRAALIIMVTTVATTRLPAMVLWMWMWIIRGV